MGLVSALWNSTGLDQEVRLEQVGAGGEGPACSPKALCPSSRHVEFLLRSTGVDSTTSTNLLPCSVGLLGKLGEFKGGQLSRESLGPQHQKETMKKGSGPSVWRGGNRFQSKPGDRWGWFRGGRSVKRDSQASGLDGVGDVHH